MDHGVRHGRSPTQMFLAQIRLGGHGVWYFGRGCTIPRPREQIAHAHTHRYEYEGTILVPRVIREDPLLCSPFTLYHAVSTES